MKRKASNGKAKLAKEDPKKKRDVKAKQKEESKAEIKTIKTSSSSSGACVDPEVPNAASYTVVDSVSRTP